MTERKLPRRWRTVKIAHSMPGLDYHRGDDVLAELRCINRHPEQWNCWIASKNLAAYGPFDDPVAAQRFAEGLCP